MNRAALITTESLVKIYGRGDAQVAALQGIDLAIQTGEFVAIMGASGSGKSTLMNILGCLDRPTSGTYRLDDVDVSTLSREALAHIRNRQIGFIFQSYNLLPRTSALENVLLPMAYQREAQHGPAAQHDRAVALLESVELGDRLHHQPQELSGGQQQRVAIARAMINDPALILADEPTGNLDSRSGEDIMRLLTDLHRRGRTIVMVTHEEDIAAFASRVIEFKDGHIIADDRREAADRPKEQDHAH